MNSEKILARIDTLLNVAKEAAKRTYEASYVQYVHKQMFFEFKSGSTSFLEGLLGSKHSFCTDFQTATSDNRLTSLQAGIGVLNAFKQEVVEGWFVTFKGFVAAEIFTDFLEMASHLLREGYKDPAAVMIGGVLEEHLRQLCEKNGISSIYSKDGKDFPKTADRMNSELTGAGTYNKLYQKSVTSWLDLRNKAAHGHYGEYNNTQVEIMESGVLDFIAKTSEL